MLGQYMLTLAQSASSPAPGELTLHAWITIVTVILAFAALAREVGPPDAIMLGAALVLCLTGVLTPQEMFHGFANTEMLTVAALFVVATGLRETGALERFGTQLLGRARSEQAALLRMAPQVIGFSAFLNNTAVVAMLLPVVSDWCRKHRVSPSRLLIPLSYLTILGGVCTLIGTSTNLVVSGLMRQARGTAQSPELQAQLAPLGFFDLSWVGVPLAIIGSIYLFTLGRRMLPNRLDLLEQFGARSREFMIEMLVQPGCPLIGKTVESAGLRHLEGLFLVEILREGRVIAPVAPDEQLLQADQLSFTGVISHIVELERTPGLTPVIHGVDENDTRRKRYRRYCEAVISRTSPLIGRSVRDSNFRARYNAAVVAVHRNGERLEGRIGDIVLREGDTLLLQSGANFAQAHRNNPAFLVVSGLNDAQPVRHERAYVALGLLAFLIGMMAFGTGFMPIVLAAFLVAGLMVVTRCLTSSEARRSVDLSTLLTIAASFAVGLALDKSGAADALASGLLSATGNLGPHAVLFAVYGVTLLATELISNNAAAALLFPLVLSVAEQTGIPARPLLITVAIAASCGFATPFGYQTHMMVYGPGGYRFSDFIRAGLPLDLVCWLTAGIIIPLVWPLT